MEPTPKGWPRISTALFYQDPRAAIGWLGRAFGFEPRLVVDAPDGSVAHSELVFGDGLIMVGTAGRRTWSQSPRALAAANSQSLLVYVDDVDAHCARARSAGAMIAKEPTTTDYGEGFWIDRSYEAVDCEGHHWWFTQRIAEARQPSREVRVKEKQGNGG